MRSVIANLHVRLIVTLPMPIYGVGPAIELMSYGRSNNRGQLVGTVIGSRKFARCEEALARLSRWA